MGDDFCGEPHFLRGAIGGRARIETAFSSLSQARQRRHRDGNETIFGRRIPIFFLCDAASVSLAFLWRLRHMMSWYSRLATSQKGAMTAMSLTCPDVPNPQLPRDSAAAIELNSQCSGPAPDQPATVATPFQPLDPDIVNAAIPAFFICRDEEGFWLVRDLKGQIGGVFLFENSALAFARRNSRQSGCATIFPSERFELDVKNQGNALIRYLPPFMRLATYCWQRTADLVGKITEAVERRFRDHHTP